MYYPDDIVEEVRSRNDIVDVISEYVGLKKAGSEYKCCCPFHHEKTPSFSVSRTKQMYHCFGCGAGGNVYTFIMRYENLTFPEAVQFLAKRAGISLPDAEETEEDKKRKSRRERLYQINKSAAAYFHYVLTRTERGKKGLSYFREKRKFSDATIQGWGLGYADIYQDDLYRYLKSQNYPDELMRDAGLVDFDEKRGPHDKFWNRVIVPITDLSGKVIGFGGRVLGDARPKYLNTKETEIFNKGRNLFALDRARRSSRKGVILCEGYMDVISQHQAGFDNAIASLGTALTEGQAGLIHRYTTDVYLAYDSDEAGVRAALRAVPILRRQGISQRIINMRPHKDPDEFLKEEGSDAFQERIRDALPGRLFEIDQISGQYDENDPEEKTKFMKETARILAGIKDVTERGNYIDTVSMKYRMDRKALSGLVTAAGLAGLDAEPEEEPEENRRRVYAAQRNAEKQNPAAETEKALLTLLVNHQDLIGRLSGIVGPEDFTDPEIQPVAEAFFREYKEKGSVTPAALVNLFSDPEQQEKVSSMFMKEAGFEMGHDELERALNDTVIRVKTDNIEKKQREGKGSQIELGREKNRIMKLKISI